MFRLTVLLFFLVLCSTGEGHNYRTSCSKDIMTKINTLEKKLDQLLSMYKSSGSCPRGWSTYDGSRSCYRFVNTPTGRWEDARKVCFGMGSDLVKIESLRENNFVTSLARSFSYKSSLMWIGLHRDVKSQKFIWVDGSALSSQYTGWDSGEPNNANGKEGCVQLRLYSFRWNDFACNYSGISVFMCEKSKHT